MLRPTSRILTRGGPNCSAQLWRQSPNTFSRRTLSTAPPSQRSRGWKNSALRWGLAIGGLYYYNTSKVFAEEPVAASLNAKRPSEGLDDASPTLDSVVAERRQRVAAERARNEHSPLSADEKSLAAPADDTSSQTGAPTDAVGDLEEEAHGEGAFNPETGEINWDCPCLGGMAHGPCGPEFREAFSCFVFSTEEPKGMDCIDRFKGMQDCFRQHPDVYGGELEDDEEEEEEVGAAADAGATAQLSTSASNTLGSNTTGPSTGQPASAHKSSVDSTSTSSSSTSASAGGKRQDGNFISAAQDRDESESLVAKSAHDVRQPVDGKGK